MVNGYLILKITISNLREEKAHWEVNFIHFQFSIMVRSKIVLLSEAKHLSIDFKCILRLIEKLRMTINRSPLIII